MQALFQVVVLAVGFVAEEEARADGLCQSAVARRAAVQRAEFDLRYSFREGEADALMEFHVFVHGDKLRFDRRDHRTRGRQNEKGASIDSNDGDSLETKIVADGRYIVFSPNVYSDGTRRAVEIGTRDDGSFHLDDIFDPRTLGLLPMSFGLYPHYRLDLHFGFDDHRFVSMEQDEIDGLQTWRCEWRRENGVAYRYWFAPSQGNSVVRAELQDEKHNLLDRLETTNVIAEQPVEWFPRRIEFTRVLEGDEVIRESLEVENARFDSPTDDAVFTIEALNVPPGRGVYERTPERHITNQIWDGNAIRTMNAQELNELLKNPRNFSMEQPPTPGSRQLALILAINSAVVAILLLAAWAQRRRMRLRDS